MNDTDLQLISNDFESVLNNLADEKNFSFDLNFNPHFLTFYIFSKLWNKYSKPILIPGKRSSMAFVMIPFCQNVFSVRPLRWGWLVLIRNGEKSSRLEFHSGAQPYQSNESNDVPVFSIFAGFWKADLATNDLNTKPRIEFNISKECIAVQSTDAMERVDIIRAAMDEIMYYWKPILKSE